MPGPSQTQVPSGVGYAQGVGMSRGWYVHGEGMSRRWACPWCGYVQGVSMSRGWVCPEGTTDV